MPDNTREMEGGALLKLRTDVAPPARMRNPKTGRAYVAAELIVVENLTDNQLYALPTSVWERLPKREVQS